MTEAPIVSREQAFAEARAVLDAARRRRDSMPIKEAARAVAAADPSVSADEVEMQIRRLRRQAAEQTARRPLSAAA